jgi:putative ABC transport system substrate-binding protein
MRRRDFTTLLTGLTMWPLAVRAQEGERVRRVGLLMGLPANDPGGRSKATALKRGLEELGWKDGRSLEIQDRWPGGRSDLVQASAKALVEASCDVIVGRSTPVVAALLRETRNIPIVFVIVVDPIGAGFVQSFARPGGNVTGFQNYEFTMVGKWLQMLQELHLTCKRLHISIIQAPLRQDFCAPSMPLVL